MASVVTAADDLSGVATALESLRVEDSGADIAAAEDDGGDDSGAEADATAASGSTTEKKKRKKKRKTKAKVAGAAMGDGVPTPARAPQTHMPVREVTFRGVGGHTDSYMASGQSDPPTIPVAKLFPEGHFPHGEELPHPLDCNAYRVTSEEKRYLERLHSSTVEELREAAEVHRTVRKYAQSIIRPGIRLVDMCEQIEDMNRRLVQVSHALRLRRKCALSEDMLCGVRSAVTR